jgi:hypothetical protein
MRTEERIGWIVLAIVVFFLVIDAGGKQPKPADDKPPIVTPEPQPEPDEPIVRPEGEPDRITPEPPIAPARDNACPPSRHCAAVTSGSHTRRGFLFPLRRKPLN